MRRTIYQTSVIEALKIEEFQKKLNTEISIVNHCNGRIVDIKYSTCVDDTHIYYSAIILFQEEVID